MSSFNEKSEEWNRTPKPIEELSRLLRSNEMAKATDEKAVFPKSRRVHFENMRTTPSLLSELQVGDIVDFYPLAMLLQLIENYLRNQLEVRPSHQRAEILAAILALKESASNDVVSLHIDAVHYFGESKEVSSLVFWVDLAAHFGDQFPYHDFHRVGMPYFSRSEEQPKNSVTQFLVKGSEFFGNLPSKE